MNEGVDLNVLQDFLEPKRETRFAKEQHNQKFIKAAADLFRKNDEDGLWRIETAEDGKDYFVRTDIVDPENVVQSSTSLWSMTADKAGENVTLAYSNVPVKRFTASEFKFTKASVNAFCKRVLSQTEDSQFKRHIVAEMGSSTKELLQKQAPELF